MAKKVETKTKSRAVASKVKVPSPAKRSEKRVAAVAQVAPTKAELPVAAAASVSESQTSPSAFMSHAELERLVRREAFRLAQRRQFRQGSPVQDWFAAETAVKAQLAAQGIVVEPRE